MANFLGNPKVQYFASGTAEFLAGGKLYSYEAGTLTGTVTYPTISDANAGTNPNTNPIILDVRGEADVVIAGATKLILKDADDNTIWTIDDVGVSAASGDIVDTAGANLLGFVSIVNSINYWQLTNASIGTAPVFAAAGGDLNITGSITSKGTGSLNIDGGVSGTVEINGTSTGAINLNQATAVTGTLTASDDTTVTGVMAATSVTATTTVTAANVIATADTSAVSATISDTLTVAGNVDFVPTGAFIWYAGTSAPTGWLHCDGAAVSRTTYSALFAITGSAFGSGDGSTTFNLPNTERRTIVGEGGTGTGTLANTVGASGGAETHTLTESEMPAHTHNTLGNSSASGSSGATLASTSLATARATSSTGGGAAHNNIQPSLVLYGLIRAL